MNSTNFSPCIEVVAVAESSSLATTRATATVSELRQRPWKAICLPLQPSAPFSTHNGCAKHTVFCVCVCVSECGKDNLIQFLFLLPKDVPEFVRVSLSIASSWGCGAGWWWPPWCSRILKPPKWRFLRQLPGLATLSIETAGWKAFPL